MKFTFLALIICWSNTHLNAQNEPQLNTITTAVPFLLIPADGRSAGVGDVGAATSPDAYSLHWNTSKLAFSDKKSEFGISYTPWLSGLVDNLDLFSLSGYAKLGERHAVGGSVSYFNIGNITFTDAQGNIIREFSPNEFEFVGGYAFRLSDRSSIGANLKYVYSNLTGGYTFGTTQTKPGQSVASDISYSYRNGDVSIKEMDANWSFGAVISNLGNKMTYTDQFNKDFIPTNLRIGTAFGLNFNENHGLTASVDFNKLLVPTAPIRDGNGEILSGKENEVGAVLGIFQSFYDAPGIVLGNTGSNIVIEKNSRLKEELREINIGGGLEYQFKDLCTVRTGYYYQHVSKGAQQYLTLGLGVNYKVIGFDVSYLNGLGKSTALTNTMRFTVHFTI